ncbi:cyclophilin-type peptidyl-prolyl cis-trans isomerase [Cyanidioschyzon merolae strain 10D]|jgi:peptidylprolyl isomerase|uniref:Peptidyl-prolyl cis-trans isomerase n=1 Tax=Cyanidioschyzon merolae (strain NIES-3377 / 10D) TaxID=280699 RepID=M1VBW6_CYAM1|nr:cyclophilin-type peptidyl-prolyl cis-trans isomerase [Cyanidioschyzon merolae strain 10D]BAM79907.1 cyclophilin-type peptidyl-prolyl cis-trans isomerase [Cyanidioschyzon merolae strain 10D]|eukprot:XP_005536193.1 cyclophilin-type peptidyl-prolyl cis-trans isomerase [Cyanidioschyzon merolae strain 10D]
MKAGTSLFKLFLLGTLVALVCCTRFLPSGRCVLAAGAGAERPRNPSSKWERITHYAYLDMAIDSERIGRVTIGLFGDTTPRTVQNFLRLARNQGVGDGKGKGTGFRQSHSHRIIPKFMIQMGDITAGDGTGGICADGRPRLPDENFLVRHRGRGYVSMANAGPHTGSSQFFITFQETPWLDGHHVVFGKIVGAESERVLAQLEAVGSASGTPKRLVTIVDSGELSPDGVQSDDVHGEL